MRILQLTVVGMLAFLLVAAGGISQRGGSGVAQSKVSESKASGEWPHHGYDASETRFSPLAQIDRSNVVRLGLAWYYDLNMQRGQESTPIMVDGRLFTTTAWSRVQAFDAASGKLLWDFDPKIPGDIGTKACCDLVNRGVAVEDGRVFLGAFDGRLIALDETTGKQVWSVMTVDPKQSYTITGAPRVVKGKVIIGNGGAEYGVRGYVTAYDAATGKLAWRFYTVPGRAGGKDGAPSDEPLAKIAGPTWKGKPDNVGGGGTVWDSMAYDPELDLLYIGVGNGGPWNQSIRSPGGGDNLFLASIVALRPDTGKYVWHFQETPGDEWDFTATQHMILADLRIGGVPRKVLMQAPKNGFFYILDRTNGKLISADPYVHQNWTTGVDPATGRPKFNPDAFYNKTGKLWVSTPGQLGGHSWHPMAYNAQTGLVYIPVNEISSPYLRDEHFEFKHEAVNIGLDLPKVSMPTDRATVDAIKADLKGRIVAWDPVKRAPRWTVELGAPWNGGMLTTAGGLLFEGTAAGDFVAYDASTGEKLWSFPAQTGIIAPPITYSVGGKQYVSLVAGWGGVYPLLLGELAKKSNDRPNRDRVLTFALDGNATLPPQDMTQPTPQAPPPSFGTPAQIDTGMRIFSRNCAGCHGDGVRSGGVLPELRRSRIATDPNAWQSVVLGGAFKDQGMASYTQDLSPADAEAVRAYVVKRANDDWKNQQ